MEILLKRAYDKPQPQDGQRIFVDRLWPRGVKKEDAAIDTWMKSIAPSTGLRKWYGHDPSRWDEFRERYFAELDQADDAIDEMFGYLRSDRVTLVFAAKDEAHSHALALKEYLERRFGSSS